MSRGTVLVVDDEACMGALVADKLKEAGYDVITTGDGESAYQIACDLALNMIVTDDEMPVVGGMELGRMLRLNPKTAGIPVLMLTGRGHRLTPTELAQTSVRRVHAKPFSVRDVVAIVEEMSLEAGQEGSLAA